MTKSFDFLPNYGYLFVDTSAIRGDVSKAKPSLRLDKELERLSCLLPSLSELPSLRTIPEVLKEYRARAIDAKRRIHRTGRELDETGSINTSCKFPKIYRHRRDVFRCLSRAVSDFESENPFGLERIAEADELKKKIKGLFYKVNGHTNEYETDIQLILASLSYAQVFKNATTLWTWDGAMAKTFAGMSRHLGLNNTGIIYQDSYVISCNNYYVKI